MTDDCITPKVLIFDSDEVTRNSIREGLTVGNIELLEARSREECVRLATSNELALILMDAQMPNMSGFETAKFLRMNIKTKEVPILFLTTIRADERYVHVGLELGAVDYIFKPVDLDILACKVDILVNYYLQHAKMERLVSDLNDAKNTLEITNAKLNNLARIDTVTELPNRYRFEEFLEAAMINAKRHNRILAVLYLDLDNFKFVNDMYGHHAGDSLLRQVSKRIQDCIRPSGFSHPVLADTLLSRLGGDEFALIICNLDQPMSAGKVAARILTELCEPFEVDGHSVSIGCSIGIACYPTAGSTPEEIQTAADTAMYKSKKDGKNTYRFFSEKLHNEHSRYLALEEGLPDAIKNNELSILYQPIFKVDEAAPVGAEALFLWSNNILGQVCASEFIPVAEQTGIIHQMGMWMCDKVVTEVNDFVLSAIKDFGVHINVSKKQLQSAAFVEFCENMLESTNLAASQVFLEVKETEILDSCANMDENLQRLYVMGYRIDVDNFGLGHFSVGRLSDLPVASIKVDRSIIESAATDKTAEIIIRSMIQLANDLEIRAVAHGIETEAQYELFQSFGCQYFQGNYLAEPMDIMSLKEACKSQSSGSKKGA